MPHARCVVLIEACEESGSYDLPAYIEDLAPRIGQPSLVVCLDSGCANYDQLWMTTSLRGLVAGTLTVEVLDRGRALGRRLRRGALQLPRPAPAASPLEDEATGEITAAGLCTPRSRPARLEQAKVGGQVLGEEVYDKFPFVPGMRPVARRPGRADPQPHLAARAVDHRRRGLPPLRDAGNVLRPCTRSSCRCASRRTWTPTRPATR